VKAPSFSDSPPGVYHILKEYINSFSCFCPVLRKNLWENGHLTVIPAVKTDETAEKNPLKYVKTTKYANCRKKTQFDVQKQI
jgi:hypothetical protein